jgi:hypothetical protein
MKMTATTEFKVWMTVDLEAGWSGDSFFCTRNRGFEWSFEAEEMLERARGSERMELDLFQITPEQLGLQGPNNVHAHEILTKGQELGFQLSPLELPAFLLLRYRDHPRFNEGFIMATRPVCVGESPNRKPHLFRVNPFRKELTHTCVCPDCYYRLGDTWVFCKTHLYPPGGPQKVISV